MATDLAGLLVSLFMQLVCNAFAFLLGTCLKLVWNLFGTVGCILGNCFGTVGELFGTFGELVGNCWGTVSELFRHVFALFRNL